MATRPFRVRGRRLQSGSVLRQNTLCAKGPEVIGAVIGEGVRGDQDIGSRAAEQSGPDDAAGGDGGLYDDLLKIITSGEGAVGNGTDVLLDGDGLQMAAAGEGLGRDGGDGHPVPGAWDGQGPAGGGEKSRRDREAHSGTAGRQEGEEDAAGQKRQIRLLRQTGYNAIRSAHNPCSKTLLDICDRLGMLVADEYIDHWYIHKTEYDYVEYFNDWWRQDLLDMVEKDYNHPCVVMYSTGNEVSETAQKKGIALTRAMTDYLHEIDGTRPVTCGVNIFFNFLSSVGFGVYSDDKARKEAEKAEKARQADRRKKPALWAVSFSTIWLALWGTSS